MKMVSVQHIHKHWIHSLVVFSNGVPLSDLTVVVLYRWNMSSVQDSLKPLNNVGEIIS